MESLTKIFDAYIVMLNILVEKQHFSLIGQISVIFDHFDRFIAKIQNDS